MELLKQRILNDAKVKDDEVLKVDMFLNHQIDVELLNEIGKEFRRIFPDKGITKILTIESSGIGIACITAQYFGVPVVFAKKTESRNIDNDVYESQVHSFTKGITYTVRVSRNYIDSSDNVLIIDDFLAKGKAAMGLCDIAEQAGARINGVGIVIEKGFQDGRNILEARGIKVESLAIVDSMKNGNIIFK